MEGVTPFLWHTARALAAALILGRPHIHAIRAGAGGLGGYLKSFATPSPVMIPLHFLENLTRTFSILIRLFGNVMSGVFVIGVIPSLAGLQAPITFMALALLTGLVQAYIFAVLAMVFIAPAAALLRRRRGDGGHCAPAGGGEHDLPDTIRRPRDDRDDGDLPPRHLAPAALGEPAPALMSVA